MGFIAFDRVDLVETGVADDLMTFKYLRFCFIEIDESPSAIKTD